MSGRTSPPVGQGVAYGTCGHQDWDGNYCGRTALYEIRFPDWPDELTAGACAEHAALAREDYTVEWMRTA